LRTLAKTIGVSDVAIAKRCREASIPLPGLGYWAKREAGKKTFQPVLPPRGLGQSNEITIGGGRHHYQRGPSDDDLIEMEVPPPPTFDEDMEVVKERARALATKVRPSTFARLHPFVAKMVEADEIRRKEYAKHNYSWYAPLFDSPNEKRRLRLINSLFNALALRGSTGSGEKKDGYELSVVIGDQRLHLLLAPKGFDRHKHYPGQIVPNKDGQLALSIQFSVDSPDVVTSWSDADGRLEARLPEIVQGLFIAAEWAYREGRRRSHGWLVENKARAIAERKRQAEEAAKAERERNERETKKRFDALVNDVRSWRTAADIRAYVEARLANTQDASTLRDWAVWALAEARRIDPLSQG
jgi:hypothetical protein